MQEESAVIDVVEKASPAVVSIVITKDVPKFKNFFESPDDLDSLFEFFNRGWSNRQRQEEPETEKQKIGGGSGFIVSSDGMIVTNKHVVEDTEADYTVITGDGKEYSAKVLARHPSVDVAIIKIEGDNFPILELGNSDNLKIGQTAIAIGNPLGEFSNSVSRGIVSGLKRDLVAGSGWGRTERLSNIIQTDAAINPGNSGGPLLNISGQAIGVNVAMAQGAENIGFALPINEVKKTIQQVKDNGKISIPFLGVRYIILNKSIQKENDLPFDYGALVLRGEKITDLAVIPGSPADKAGIVENDIILEINGEKITEKNQLNDLIVKYSVGDEITLKIWHKGKEKEVKVKLEERK
ncbi:trypsin-like peptidase domain-containing protein [bacterium]|nr:trypsin-like peptidase domain-containing protein [bacterium]